MKILTSSRIVACLISVASVISASSHAQQVAILDSGVDPSRGFNVVGGFNYFNNTTDTSDVSDREGEGHGTVSARVITEFFDGEIVPFVVTDGGFDLSFEDQVRTARDSALSDILGKDDIRVVGITWGTPGVVGASASLMPNLSNAGKFIAIMAGNDAASQPNALATASFNLAGVVIVGGTDANGDFLPNSNRAGTTAERFVAANGLPSDTATEGGNSWAAARISGIAGAVFQQNPDLTAEQVADVILRSAEDRGEAGTDSEFGRGVILSAEQVLNNVIGPVTVPTDPTPPEIAPTPVTNNGGGGGGGGAGLLIGGALAGAILLSRKPKAKLEKTLVLDSYGRAFELDMNPHIQVNDQTLHLNDFFHALDQTAVHDGVYLPALNTEVVMSATTNQDHRLDMIEYFAMPDDRVINNRQANVSLALRTQLTSQLAFDSGYRVNAAQMFGAASELERDVDFGNSAFISGQSFGSVLSGFSRQADIASVEYVPNKFSARLGLVSVDTPGQFQRDSLSTIFQGGYQFTDNVGVRVQFGQLEEKSSILGGAAGGIFSVENSTTYALNVSGKLQASKKIAVVANYGVGKTKVETAEKSLLSNFTDLRSNWYSLGLIGNDIFRQQDQFGLALSQPLKVRSGYVDYALPTGRAANGDIEFDRDYVNLADTGATERSLEGYYRTKLANDIELGAFVAYRQNPNHVDENGNELLMMATLRFQQ